MPYLKVEVRDRSNNKAGAFWRRFKFVPSAGDRIALPCGMPCAYPDGLEVEGVVHKDGEAVVRCSNGYPGFTIRD